MEIFPPTEQDKHLSLYYVAHRLPCTIHVDGELPTARAFCPFPEPMTSFRGRKLQSAKFQVPSSSQLVVLEKQSSKGSEDSTNDTFQIRRVLDNSLVHYEHDDYPAENTSVPLALKCLAISNTLHEPISSTELTNPTENGKAKSEPELEIS